MSKKVQQLLPLSNFLIFAIFLGVLGLSHYVIYIQDRPIPAHSEKAIYDSYNKDNALGNLNGNKIEIPWFYETGVITYVDNDYSDSRTTHKKRTFESEIKELGFEFNYKTNAIWTVYNNQQHDDEIKKPPHTWVNLYVHSSNWYPARADTYFERTLASELERYTSIKRPLFYQKVQFPDWHLNGYKTIIIPNVENMKGIHTDDIKEDYKNSKDIFYATDTNGKITSYILCSNAPVINPPCKHMFLIKDKRLQVHLSYGKHGLPLWQEIEKMATQHIFNLYK